MTTKPAQGWIRIGDHKLVGQRGNKAVHRARVVSFCEIDTQLICERELATMALAATRGQQMAQVSFYKPKEAIFYCDEASDEFFDHIIEIKGDEGDDEIALVHLSRVIGWEFEDRDEEPRLDA
jgi:hypothetical protein